MDIITVTVCALATARLTRLVTTDRITEAPRNWIIRRLPRESLLSYLLVCDWCSSGNHWKMPRLHFQRLARPRFWSG